jgi:hypothetical protein
MEPKFRFVHYEETLNFEHETIKTSTAKLASTSSGNSFCVARMPNFRSRWGIFKTATRLKEVWVVNEVGQHPSARSLREGPYLGETEA